ncbi:MAG: 16S rRNA (uracil(1498)-N(3))-methyltransferase [Deltaproteobacteria bacterium]|nr:16S rRNA (uracil(1498)-N(3))-methyltransferase [Deltaproteobacteria bacterium]
MIRVPVSPLVEGRQTLNRDTSHYVCRVLRLGAGANFIAFDPTAKAEAIATVVAASGEAAEIDAQTPRPASIVASTSLVLVYCLSKGDKVDAVVRDATELGATSIVVARSSRSIVKTDDERAAAKLDRWRRIVDQAARQCGRADPPRVEGILPWAEALSLACSQAEARYCLWESATEPLGTTLQEVLARNTSLAFAVGPEGGLSSEEVDVARAIGFQPKSLGRFVLRTETVPAAVLGAVRILAAS